MRRRVLLISAVGLTLTACGGGKASPPPLRGADVYLGLDCGDNFPCPRLGIAVWLANPATDVRVTVHGHVVVLSAPPRGHGRTYWQGFVRDPRAEAIAGQMERHVSVRIEARAPDGSLRRRTDTIPVSPGWS